MSGEQSADVVVIGGGLAGGCTAFSLARRGYSVVIIDAAPALAQKASGNRYGLVTPYIAAKSSSLHTLYAAGFAHSLALLSSDSGLHALYTRCGAIQLPSTSRLNNLTTGDTPLYGAPIIRRVDTHEASALSNIEIRSAALYVPDAGFLSPARFIDTLMSIFSHKIEFQGETRAITLQRDADSWRVVCLNGGSLKAPRVVICGAHESTTLDITSWLPLEPVRGQTATITSTIASDKLCTVVCFGGYLTPAITGEHLLGAHYRHGDFSEEPTQGDTEEILNTCNEWLPSLSFLPETVRSTRVCFRTSTIDRLPYIGKLPDYCTMKREASRFQSGSDLSRRVPIRYHDGVFVHVGHGSRGLLSAPLGGEIIARLIAHEPLGELGNVAATVCPDRLPYRLLRC